MTSAQTQIIQNTWAAVSKIEDEIVGSIFYNRLFEIAPQVRPMFKSSIPEQSKKLMTMLHFLVRNLHQPQEITHGLTQLAQRHTKYQVKSAHYDIVGSALLYTLEKGLGELWTADTREAWTTLYSFVANTMIAASAESKAA